MGVQEIMQTVAELAAFRKSAEKFLNESEIADFVSYIAANPQAGSIMPRCGGLRKIRWSRQSSGKSGGARIIYYMHSENRPLFLVYAYAKAKSESLTRDQEKTFATLVGQIKESWKNG